MIWRLVYEVSAGWATCNAVNPSCNPVKGLTAGDGCCVVLRPAESVCASADIRLRGVDESKNYKVARLDGSQERIVSGRELALDITIALGPEQSEVLRLQRQD